MMSRSVKRIWWVALSVVSLCEGQASARSHDDGLVTAIRQEERISWLGLLKNISPAEATKGAVIASPSRSQPDYFYHWTRDAALVMDVVVRAYTGATSISDRDMAFATVMDYVNFSRLTQEKRTPSGSRDNHYQGFGEPKYFVNGEPYTGPWGRPQNDGPALRAITLSHFIMAARTRSKPEVLDLLYQANPDQSILKADLEFVLHHWRGCCFDLWEEVRGHHFYTMMVQRHALLLGAAIADAAQDPLAAVAYRGVAREIEGALTSHWDAGRGLIVPTRGRDGGLDYKHQDLDSSVLLAVLHTRGPGQIFAASDGRVMHTALLIEGSFAQLYAINSKSAPGPLAPAIGRYPEDRYDGVGASEGNPWFLTTLAMAEYYYTVAEELGAAHEVRITALNKPFLAAVGLDSLVEGETIAEADPRFPRLVAGLIAKGDRFMRRVFAHLPQDGTLPEQLSRGDGTPRGARDLTWSYASFLTAASARPKVHTQPAKP